MALRPEPELDPEETYFGRPIPRGGVSLRGSNISWIIPFWALVSLTGLLFEVWRGVTVGWNSRPWWFWCAGLLGLSVQWLALFFAGFYLALACGMRYETRRIHPLLQQQERRAMLAVVAQSLAAPNVFTAWGRYTFVGLVALVSSLIFTSFRPLAFLVAACAMYYALFLRITNPPAAVFLGSSDRTDVNWHWTLLGVARPLRIISCLDTEHAETRFKRFELTYDCLRSASSSSEQWLVAVQALALLSPLVLVDGTATTPFVETEMRFLLENDLGYKCIVLCGPAGERQLLDAMRVPRGHLCVVPAGAALTLITQILAQGLLPSPKRPVSQVATEINLWFAGFMERPTEESSRDRNGALEGRRAATER